MQPSRGSLSGERLVAALTQVCADFADMTSEWAIQGIMSASGLDLVTRELLLVASCATLGFALPQLRTHIESALALGATRQQVIETILQMTPYAGGVATSNALRMAAEVFSAAEAARQPPAPEPTAAGRATTASSTSASKTCDKLADFRAVVDTLYRFGAGQDSHDRQLFESAFSENAELDFSQPARRLGLTLPLLRGRARVVDDVMSTLAGLDSTHTVTNPRVTFEADEAELFALADAYHLLHDSTGRHLQLKNIYRAWLVRGDGDWRIARLKIENVWFNGDPALLFGQVGSQTP